MVSRRERLEIRAGVLADQLGKIAEEISSLADRPAEPASDVIRFTKKFRDSGRSYNYVARRTADRRAWFVSGRTNFGNKTWDELLDFIEVDDPNALATVEAATKWKALVTK